MRDLAHNSLNIDIGATHEQGTSNKHLTERIDRYLLEQGLNTAQKTELLSRFWGRLCFCSTDLEQKLTLLVDIRRKDRSALKKLIEGFAGKADLSLSSTEVVRSFLNKYVTLIAQQWPIINLFSVSLIDSNI